MIARPPAGGALTEARMNEPRRPLDAAAGTLMVGLTLLWGLQQVAIKLAAHGATPLTQASIRSALALVLLLAWKRRRDAALADAAGVRRKAADKVARKRLSEAAEALGRNDRDAFYTALSRALHGYLADKFTLGVAEVNAATLRERMGPGEVADRFIRLIDACAMARFAPVEDRSRQELYDEAAALITRIENEQRA